MKRTTTIATSLAFALIGVMAFPISRIRNDRGSQHQREATHYLWFHYKVLREDNLR